MRRFSTRNRITILFLAALLILAVSSMWARAGAPAAAKAAGSVAAVAAYPESEHPYSNNFNFNWVWQSGTPATYLDVTFDSLTMLGTGDRIEIVDGYGQNIEGSPFTGASLAGAVKRIPGSNFQIRLVTDAAGTAYGFKVINIVPLDIGAPDLVLSKFHLGNFAAGQVGAMYTIQVRNVGTGPTMGTVTVADQLPSNMSATSISGEGWDCFQPAGPCSRSDALPSRASYPPLRLYVNVLRGGSVVNRATVSGGSDTNSANNFVEDPTDIDSTGPDLSISKLHAADFIQGQTGATYTILVSNVGQAPTKGLVTVADILPPGLTATGISGSGWLCTQPAGPCTRPDALPNGGTYQPIVVTVNVAANASGRVTNVATVSTTGDVNSNNDIANDQTRIRVIGPDSTIVKSHTGDFKQGQTGATYTLTVSNIGSQPTSGQITVTETPPAQGLTITSMTGSGWNCAQPAGPCTRNDALPVDVQFPPITVTVNVANNSPLQIINTASVSGGGDADTTNNLASDPTTVQGNGSCTPLPESPHPYPANFNFTWTCTVDPGSTSVEILFDPQTFVEDGVDFISITDANGVPIPGSPFTGTSLAGKIKTVPGSVAKITLTSDGRNEGYGFKITALKGVTGPSGTDLSISKTHTGNFYQGHRGALYSIVVRNAGSVSSSGEVTVVDTLPTGMTAASISGQGWTCTQPSGPCKRSDALAPNTSYPAITLAVNVALNAPASLTNTATVSGGSDNNAANNTATDPTSILVPEPLCPLPESAHPTGENVDMSWSCVQPGNPASIDVTFDPMTLLGDGDVLYIMDKNGNNIAGSPFGGSSLAGATQNVPGDTLKLRLVTNDRRSEWGFRVTKIASAGGSGGGPTAPDLTLTKTHSGNFSQGQNGATYSILVKNDGTAATTGQVSVSDNLPAGLTATSIGGSGWTCAQPLGPCTRNDVLNAGGSYPVITLTVNVAANAPALVTNTATVSGGGETNQANDTAGDSTTITPAPGGTCSPLESAHDYPPDYDNTWVCTLGGNFTSLNVTFDAQTAIDSSDQLFITNGSGVNIAGSPFTGTTLGGQTVNVPGTTVRIRLVSDSRRQAWGFKVTSVVGVP